MTHITKHNEVYNPNLSKYGIQSFIRCHIHTGSFSSGGFKYRKLFMEIYLFSSSLSCLLYLDPPYAGAALAAKPSPPCLLLKNTQ